MARAKNWRLEKVYGTISGNRFAALTYLPTGQRVDVRIRGSKDGKYLNEWGDPYPYEETRRGKIYEMADKLYATARYGKPNPKGLSTCEERQYKAIVRRGGYGKRTKEVAARTVLARRARVSARGRRARNPKPRGTSLGERGSFTLSTLRAVKRGGIVERIWYKDARDGLHYYHDFDNPNGDVMYLCESAAVGKCILIVSGDLATPLWENT